MLIFLAMSLSAYSHSALSYHKLSTKFPKSFQEDCSTPIQISISPIQDEQRAWNHGVMAALSSLGRRVKITVAFEIQLKVNGRWNLKRLKGQYIHMSCPTPEQADLALVAIGKFLASLNGKFLAADENKPSEAGK